MTAAGKQKYATGFTKPGLKLATAQLHVSSIAVNRKLVQSWKSGGHRCGEQQRVPLGLQSVDCHLREQRRDARRRAQITMASSLAKHRYFTFVATSSQMDDAEGIARVLRQRALAELGEVGLGRLGTRIYFHERATRVVVVRVARSSALHFKALAGASCRVVACSGSLRTCKPRVRRLLRERNASAAAFEALERLR